MLKTVYIKILVTVERHQIMPVSLMIAEKQILAMRGINFLPVLQCKFYGRKRRVMVCLVGYSVLLQETVHLFYSFTHVYPRKLSRMPAATAEPMTPATFGPIACISR